MKEETDDHLHRSGHVLSKRRINVTGNGEEGEVEFCSLALNWPTPTLTKFRAIEYSIQKQDIQC